MATESDQKRRRVEQVPVSDILLDPVQKIAFSASPGLRAVVTGGRNVWVVGKKQLLCAAAKELAEVLSNPVIAKQAEALEGGYKGATAESSWLEGEQLRKLTLVALPEAAGRLVTKIRPDCISKLLHGKIAGGELILAVEDADVLPAGLAAARSLSPFTAKTEKARAESVCNVTFFGCQPSAETLQILTQTAEGIRVTQGLVDLPPNMLFPKSYKDLAIDAVKSIPGVSYTSIEGDELLNRGYGLIHAVGRAAATPPCLLVLTHKGDGSNKKAVAIVGKGITFDTGGAALKPAAGMCGMKRDMGGSAGVLGAFLALAKAGGLPSGQPLHCVLCIAENAIGSRCFLHDDILTGYSGLTVEISNTDAEGRLVLADGVSHVAKHLDCELIVEMATLTGASGIATGTHHACFLASDDALEKDAVAAGLSSGDMVHPSIFAPELLMHEFDSDFADMRNHVKNGMNAPSAAAGLFIYRHLTQCGYQGRWMHVDMAKPVQVPLDGYGTGWGVGLLTTLLRSGLSKAIQSKI